MKAHTLFDLFRSVNNGNGGYYSLEVDGVATNSVHMINDNDWNAFKWQHDVYPENQPKLYLTKGKHTVKFIIGEGGNFNYKSYVLLTNNKIVYHLSYNQILNQKTI